jgi:hypothetical protein
MANFRVTFEIEVEASCPLVAAMEVQRWLRKDDWQFYVQNSEDKKIYSVDLDEHDDDAVIEVEYYNPIITKK